MLPYSSRLLKMTVVGLAEWSTITVWLRNSLATFNSSCPSPSRWPSFSTSPTSLSAWCGGGAWTRTTSPSPTWRRWATCWAPASWRCASAPSRCSRLWVSESPKRLSSPYVTPRHHSSSPPSDLVNQDLGGRLVHRHLVPQECAATLHHQGGEAELSATKADVDVQGTHWIFIFNYLFFFVSFMCVDCRLLSVI